MTESAETSQDSRNGNVTVASNLPDGDAAGGGGSANNENSETRSLTNYEISQVERQIIKGPGDVRRLTVAVLVNDVVETADDGTISFTPRTEEELAGLKELVSLAVGLDEARGDLITLQSMPFEQVADAGTLVSDVAATTPLNLMQLLQVAVAAVVALILGLFVVRPILAGKPNVEALPAPESADNAEAGLIDVTARQNQISGPTEASPDAVARLREMIAERESETVQLLQEWMEDPSKKESA